MGRACLLRRQGRTWSHDRVTTALDDQVFGALPAGLTRRLDQLGASQVLLTLVARGWTPEQLAARVAVLPTSADGVGQVLGFLQALLGEETAAERTGREQRARRQSAEVAQALAPTGTTGTSAPAATWPPEGATGLEAAPSPATAEPARTARARCALCERVADFVTERVQLCDRCVQVLQSGQARLQITA